MSQRLPTSAQIQSAALPAPYEHAKQALAECERIDEAKTWADKAQAVAAYARMADDKELEQMALRIRARASRRCGELLKELPTVQGARTDLGDTALQSPRYEAAEAAGMSRDQAKQAMRVASVPDEDFEQQVESDSPPTITKLAEQGTAKKPKPDPVIEGMRQGATDDELYVGTQAAGAIAYMLEESSAWHAQPVARGSRASLGALIWNCERLIEWLSAVVQAAKKEQANETE